MIQTKWDLQLEWTVLVTTSCANFKTFSMDIITEFQDK